jgi:hypothetical protein
MVWDIFCSLLLGVHWHPGDNCITGLLVADVVVWVKIGLLWYDDSGLDFATKVQYAAERYREKYGKTPNCVYVHPSTEIGEVPRIKVIKSVIVLRDHFWVGVI